MRSLVYTVSIKTVPVFETFSHQTATEFKNQGYDISTRFVERPARRTPKEKEYLARRFAKLAGTA